LRGPGPLAADFMPPWLSNFKAPPRSLNVPPCTEPRASPSPRPPHNDIIAEPLPPPPSTRDPHPSCAGSSPATDSRQPSSWAGRRAADCVSEREAAARSRVSAKAASPRPAIEIRLGVAARNLRSSLHLNEGMRVLAALLLMACASSATAFAPFAALPRAHARARTTASSTMQSAPSPRTHSLVKSSVDACTRGEHIVPVAS
jgi:hypothetical protein